MAYISQDFSEKYQVPPIRLAGQAREILKNYSWPGNIRQLKNITEQISVIETQRDVAPEVLQKYLPTEGNYLPALVGEKPLDEKTFASEREILYKILFDMRKDMDDLKHLVKGIIEGQITAPKMPDTNVDAQLIRNLYSEEFTSPRNTQVANFEITTAPKSEEYHIQDTEEVVEETLSIEAKEIELIRKALEKHGNRRKHAAQELGISERTLYRKIKEYDIQ